MRTTSMTQTTSTSIMTWKWTRALQGHSGRNLIDPSLQDNVLIPDDFFKYMHHVGCASDQFRIDTGRSNFEQKTDCIFVFCLWILWIKNTKDPETIDLEAPSLARYMHTAWKKHQNTVYWVDIKLAQKKGLNFYQTRSNAIILHETLPACCIPKAVRMRTGEIMYEKVYESPRPLPKISLWNDWMKELGSEVARQADGSQPTQQNPNPNHDRTGRPVLCENTSRSSAQEIDTRFSLDCQNTNLFVWTLRERQRHRQRRRCRSRKNGEARCEWTTNRLVHKARRGGHRF